MNGPERQDALNAPALKAPGFQRCPSNSIPLPIGVLVPTGTIATVSLPVAQVVTLIFSTEIRAPSGGRVDLLYSIDGTAPRVIGPEFFSDDSAQFVTRTAMAATIPPFGALLPAGTHTIQPILRASFGTGAGTAFFRCFTAEP